MCEPFDGLVLLCTEREVEREMPAAAMRTLHSNGHTHTHSGTQSAMIEPKIKTRKNYKNRVVSEAVKRDIKQT